jgi:tetratricopeptide (TPR) repeat protein
MDQLPPEVLTRPDFIAACADHDLGRIFAIAKKWGGWTNTRLGRACRLSPSRVAEYLTHQREATSARLFERVADGLGIPGEYLLLAARSWQSGPPSSNARNDGSPQVAHADGLDEDDEMKRRDLLRVLSVLGAQMSPLDVAFNEAQASLPRVDQLTAHAHLNGHLWGAFSLASSKAAVYPLVREQLTALTSELEHARSEPERTRLCSLAGDLLQLAGEIFFDANRYTEAAQNYTLAATASTQARDFDLWACALTRHAYVSIYERSYNQTVPVLDAASRVASNGDSQLSTRHWVAAVQAEVFAELGDFDACSKALDKAESVQNLSGQIHNGGWLRFDGSRLDEQRGACYTRLGRYDLAETALTSALASNLTPRRRGGVLVDLARLGVQQHDPDQAFDYGRSAVELAQSTGSGYIAKKLTALQADLAPLIADRRISTLADSIHTLLSTTGQDERTRSVH